VDCGVEVTVGAMVMGSRCRLSYHKCSEGPMWRASEVKR